MQLIQNVSINYHLLEIRSITTFQQCKVVKTTYKTYCKYFL